MLNSKAPRIRAPTPFKLEFVVIGGGIMATIPAPALFMWTPEQAEDMADELLNLACIARLTTEPQGADDGNR